MRFIAIAGRSDLATTAARADELFQYLDWGLDDSIWELYNVPYQPYSVLITGDDIVMNEWFGAVDEQELRAELDRLVATTGA